MGKYNRCEKDRYDQCLLDIRGETRDVCKIIRGSGNSLEEGVIVYNNFTRDCH